MTPNEAWEQKMLGKWAPREGEVLKPHYVWDHKNKYWRESGRSNDFGYKWTGRNWSQVWREPPADSPNCWIPSMAGKLVRFWP